LAVVLIGSCPVGNCPDTIIQYFAGKGYSPQLRKRLVSPTTDLAILTVKPIKRDTLQVSDVHALCTCGYILYESNVSAR